MKILYTKRNALCISQVLLVLLTVIIFPFSQTVFAQYGALQGNHLENVYKTLNKDSSLHPFYNQSACGLNYSAEAWVITKRCAIVGNTPGIGLPATINFLKLPPNIIIDTAFLWWTTSSDLMECFTNQDTANKYCTNISPSFDDNFNLIYCGTPKYPKSMVTVTNPKNVTTTYESTKVGTGGPTGWSEIETQTFRADVTKSISGNGIYTLNITKDPGDSKAEWETNGFMLMVIYRDTSATYQGTLIINDGCYTRGISNYTCGSPITDSITGFSACDNTVNARAFLVVSDLQRNIRKTFNAILNGNTVIDSSNFFNLTNTPTNVTKGQNVSIFEIDSVTGTTKGSTDCYTLAVTGLYYQTTTCATCPIKSSDPSDTTSSTTSVKNETAVSGIQIYPNPSDGKTIHLKWSNGNQTNQFVMLSVYDMLNQKIYTTSISVQGKNTETIVTFNQPLPLGVYLLEIAGNNYSQKYKMIVN